MISIKVKCPSCKKQYLADELNTKFRGLYIVTECSKCGKIYDDKFLTFIISQAYDDTEDEINRFECCSKMIYLARELDNNLNPEPIRKSKK